MLNRDAIPLIHAYQNHYMRKFESLYAAFYPLLVHYGSKIGDEDAIQDLTVFFMELLFKIDLDRFRMDDGEDLQRYIAVAIRNRYIAMSKERQKIRQTEITLCEYIAGSKEDTDTRIALQSALAALSEAQRRVLLLRYYYGYRDAEIADLLQISRQAVNRQENRALKALRNTFYS